MRKRVFVFLLVVASAVIAGLVIGSQYPAYGQAGRIGGSYQLRILPPPGSGAPDIVYLATVASDGGVILTVPPLSCFPTDADYSFSTGHGTWGIVATLNGPRIRFHMLSALYASGEFRGFLQMVGETPLQIGDETRGAGDLTFPDSLFDCQREFGGPIHFAARAIPVIPQPPTR